MSCLSTVEFFKKFNSMCKTQVCAQCELRKHSHEIMCAEGIAYDCKNFLFDHPEIAVPIIEQYGVQDPPLTFLQDVKAKYPAIPLSSSGMPFVCAQSLGYIKVCPVDMDSCIDCWNRPMIESSKEG